MIVSRENRILLMLKACFFTAFSIFYSSLLLLIFILKDGEFVWSPNLQGVILGAFYYGYCITQIPGGRMSEIYSAKWVYGIGTFITALLTLVTPLAARWHYGVLIFIRALEGLAQVRK